MRGEWKLDPPFKNTCILLGTIMPHDGVEAGVEGLVDLVELVRSCDGILVEIGGELINE